MFKLAVFAILLVVPTSFSRSLNDEEDKGHYIQFDDMLLTEEQHSNMLQRKMMTDSRFYWKKTSEGVIEIPWKIEDPNVDPAVVKQAQDEWQANTCIVFKPLTGSTEGVSYFRYTADPTKNCIAGLGNLPGRSTLINLYGWYCKFRGALHEIGHAIGFQHEMSRSDRDPHIIIIDENISLKVSFTKEDTIAHGVPYDYMSIMHYQASAGAKPGTVGMLATDPRFQSFMGNYKTFSHMDTLLFNKAYKCIDDWLKKCGKPAEDCQNLGYTFSDCKCRCPAGTSGDKCENKEMEYNDALIKELSPLTKKFTNDGDIVEIPGYPKPSGSRMQYTQVIEAPKCKKVVLTFEDFKIYGKHPYTTCRIDILQIRTDVRDVTGTTYCGSDIAKGTVIKSQNNMLILHFQSGDFLKWGFSSNPNPGYKAKVSFEDVAGCS